MPIVVTDNCHGCRFTECATVCPVACFHGDGNMLYIDSGACIECRACIPVCPVKAIADSIELPPEKLHWVDVNRDRSKLLPAIEEKQPTSPAAEARRAALGFAV